ncbi:MAG TPA: UDP-N-acetylmuramoyl-L-alanine--D-glutamate ligase [Coxiellaceae bacterium]|nr:UDP-N-acetylmuramoyl-L-alanine--D-glutamate ligase [Coxiellaceae bacterium]
MYKFADSSKFYLIIGLGVTGLSCLRYLVKQGCQVAVNDSRESPPCLIEAQQQFPNIQIVTGEFSAELIQQADEIIVSPGVALTHPLLVDAKARCVPIVGDIELFARVAKAPIVAITGSNGKSTVTTLVGLMAQQAGLKVKVGGNLGTPVLDFLNEPEPDCYVLELSSFQLDTTYSLRATAAIVLNVTPDHMDRYATFTDYVHSKQAIYAGCQHAVVNWDEPATWQELDFINKPLAFSINTAPIQLNNVAELFGLITEQNQVFLSKGREKLLSVDAMKLKGKHNWQNALAALALGSIIHLPMKAMLQVLQDFPGLPHRCEWVATIHDVDWINDSKGTNVGATQSALMGFGELLSGKRIVLIAGGQAKGADVSVLNPELQRYVKHVIVLGEDAPILMQNWQKVAPIERVNSLAEAVKHAALAAQAGDTVLLSPACASLDMFKNYEDRGEQFVELVRRLS